MSFCAKIDWFLASSKYSIKNLCVTMDNFPVLLLHGNFSIPSLVVFTACESLVGNVPKLMIIMFTLPHMLASQLTIIYYEMKKWSSQLTQFMQLRREAWIKFRTSTGFEHVTLRLPVRCSTNWAMKPLMLGAGQFWVHMFPWRKWVLMIYEMNHMWTAEMKWNEEMIVIVNDHFFISFHFHSSHLIHFIYH